MGIETDGKIMYLYCDVCGEKAAPDFYTFDDLIAYKRTCGWKSQRRDGEWEDVCPKCQVEKAINTYQTKKTKSHQLIRLVKRAKGIQKYLKQEVE